MPCSENTATIRFFFYNRKVQLCLPFNVINGTYNKINSNEGEDFIKNKIYKMFANMKGSLFH